jgi:hypothetical protein
MLLHNGLCQRARRRRDLAQSPTITNGPQCLAMIDKDPFYSTRLSNNSSIASFYLQLFKSTVSSELVYVMFALLTSTLLLVS